MKPKKTETLEEYLARGGVITVVAPNARSVKEPTAVQAVAGGPATILSLDEYDTYYGDPKKNPKKPKKQKASLDLNALPEHLRKKHIKRLLEEAGLNEEDFQES